MFKNVCIFFTKIKDESQKPCIYGTISSSYHNPVLFLLYFALLIPGLAQEQQLPTPPKMGLPSLPDPTGPPPPPPPAFQTSPEQPVAPLPIESQPNKVQISK